MNVLTLDFETYWADDYTLSKMTTEAYVRDPRFKAHMVGMQMNDNAPVVIPHEKMPEVFSKIPWGETAVVAQHAHFDLFILSHRYGIRPAFIFDTLSMFRALYPAEAASLANQCRVLGLPPKGLELINSKNKYNLSPHEYQELAGYCTNDVRLTRRIFGLLKPSFPISELRLIDLTVRLFTEPVLRLNRTLLEDALEDEKKRMVALLTRVFPEREGEIWAAIVRGDKDALDAIKKPLSSNPQFAELLLNLGIDPPKKLSPAAVKKGIADPEYDYEPPIGLIDQLPKKALEVYRKLNNDAAHPSEKWAYAFSKSDEAFKHLLNHDDETVVGLVEARLGVKSTIRETRTKSFLSVASRGTFPIYLKYYGAHCVTGDVEVLTPSGWQRLDCWQGGDIAQVHPNQRIEFLPAKLFVGPTEKEWVHVDAPYINAQFTKGHTVPYLSHGSFTCKTLQAGSLHTRASLYIPNAGFLSSEGTITPEQMKVLVMVQADGSYEQNAAVGRGLRIFLKKPRKIERARKLLREANVPFSEQTYPSHPGFTRFIIRWADLPAWLTPERKFFGPWLLDSTLASRVAFMSEIIFWDGHQHRSGQDTYSTSVAANAEWVATMAHLHGKGASICTKEAKGNRKAQHTVVLRNRSHCMIERAHIRSVEMEQQTYCTITQTGFWLARSNGRIFVTGNTGRFGGGDRLNPQNLTRSCPLCEGAGCDRCAGTGVSPLRRSIEAPEGYVIVVRDLSAIEARMNFWLAGQTDKVEAYRRGEDIYCKAATDVFGRPITKQDKKERFLGKVQILGCGYGLSWRKLQGMLRVGALGNKGMVLGTDIAEALGVTGEQFLYKNSAYVLESLPPNCDELTHATHCACTQQIIKLFRDNNYKVPEFWNTCQEALARIARGERWKFGTNGVLETCKEGIRLPNGMIIRYVELRVNTEGRRVEYSVLRNVKKGERERLYGGKVDENCAQALSRIILTDAMLKMKAEGIQVVHNVHDEILVLAKEAEAEAVYKRMGEIMSTPPVWAPDLPLASEGGFAKQYIK